MAKNKKNSLSDKFKSLTKFKSDERVRLILGLSSLTLALVLALSFFSFFFTWDEDQSVLMYDSVWQFLFDTTINVDNWGAKLGAVLSKKFIHDWFGIASFSFVLILLILGFRFLKLRLLPLRKTTKISLFGTLVVSITFGYLFGDTWNANLGGFYGYFIGNKFIPSLLGTVGAGLVILILIAAFIIYSFKDSIRFLRSLFNTDNEDEIPVTEEEVDGDSDSPDNGEETTEIEDDESDDVSEEKEETRELEMIVEDSSANKEEESLQDIELIEINEEIVEEEAVTDEDDSDEEDLDLEVTKNTEDADKADFLNYEVLGDYDPTKELSNYRLPKLELLEDYQLDNKEVSKAELEANKNKIVETLEHYNIIVTKIFATIGPTITLYEIVPKAGTRVNKIKSLEDDIALSIAALGIRIIAPIPGKGTIGIEVPNQKPKMVSMKSILQSKAFQESKFELPVAIGKTIQNETYVFNLAKMPHLLVAGATGQGKSVGLNAILASLLYKKHPSQLKFVLIDPKKVELTLYQRIENHFLAKLPDEEEAIITDTQKVVNTLNSLCIEMDERYELLKAAKLRNITEYNAKFKKRRLNPEKGHRFMPYIVVVIDEFADLIMTAGKEVELPLARLAQLARAIGIHLIIATQRPTTNIITGVIKANFPGRIAFRVQSSMDSRTILDTPGANQLIGKGDMLISEGSSLIRVQCAFIDTPELDKVTEFIGEQQGYGDCFPLPEYSPDDGGGDSGMKGGFDKYDANFTDAAHLVVNSQQGSTSLIQRKLAIGYNRAGRIMDQLEDSGIVGPFEGSKARQVLIPDIISLEQFLDSLKEQGKI